MGMGAGKNGMLMEQAFREEKPKGRNAYMVSRPAIWRVPSFQSAMPLVARISDAFWYVLQVLSISKPKGDE
jgi:hypothetical protein